MSNRSHRVFLITGVSSGFWHAFAEAALAAGNTVIGTLRSEAARLEFENLHATRAHGVVLDVADLVAVEPTINQAAELFGPVDVLVNNAGYGHEGIIESRRSMTSLISSMSMCSVRWQ